MKASSISLSAQRFNFLNDINNLTLKRTPNKATPEEKEDLLHHLEHDRPKAFGPTQVAKYFGLQVKDITGWRLNTQGKPEIHSLKPYRQWQKVLDVETIPTRTLNGLAKAVTLSTDTEGFKETLQQDLPDLDPKLLDTFVDHFKDLKVSGAKWHSLSVETLDTLIPHLLKTSKEQHTLQRELGLFTPKHTPGAKVDIKAVTQDIYNPVVSKSVREALKILNRLVEDYPKVSHITVELPRESNTNGQKDRIKEFQRKRQKDHDKANQYFLDQSGWSEEKFQEALTHTSLKYKLQYYYEQDGVCAYSGKRLDPNTLAETTEVDHILPLSLSLNDTVHNKVLVTKESNQEKGQRTTLEAFEAGCHFGQSKADFTAWVNGSNHLSKKKKQNLLYAKDLSKHHLDFVNRNLNDTRYISRTVFNALQDTFPDVHVKAVNGAFTHTLRKRWSQYLGGPKTRETHHHHAVDAVLCAVSPHIHITPFEYLPDTKEMVDTLTGEVLSYKAYQREYYHDRFSYRPKWGDNFLENLNPTRLYPRIQWSHTVDKKSNRKLSDATIYSTRTITNAKGKDEEWVVGNLDLFNGDDPYKAYCSRRDKGLLLIQRHDPRTFQKLEQDIEPFKDAKNPFKAYVEAHGALRTYSRNGLGSPIRQLKYLNTKYKQGIDLSHKHPSKTKRTILQQRAQYRTDMFYNGQEYKFLAIYQADLRYTQKGTPYVPKETYQDRMKAAGITSQDRFVTYLHKGDILTLTKGGESIDLVFRSMGQAKGPLCFKPLDREEFTPDQDLSPLSSVSQEYKAYQWTVKDCDQITKST